MEKVRIVKYALGIPFPYLKYAYVKSSLSNIDHLCGKLYFFCYLLVESSISFYHITKRHVLSKDLLRIIIIPTSLDMQNYLKKYIRTGIFTESKNSNIFARYISRIIEKMIT